MDVILGGVDEIEGAPSAHLVEETVSRERVVAIQTPQVFERALLERAYQQDSIDGATDDAMLVEQLGEPVVVVEGEGRNLKVTTPEDLTLARLLAR